MGLKCCGGTPNFGFGGAGSSPVNPVSFLIKDNAEKRYRAKRNYRPLIILNTGGYLTCIHAPVV